MTTRPTKFPRWASSDITENETGQSNVVEPPEGKKDEGWDYKEKPPFNWFNWLLRFQHDWLAHLDGVANQFSVYEADPADYTVMIGAGNHRSGVSYNQFAERQTSAFSLPGSDDRIDLVCLARADGSIVTVTGTESTSPSSPDVPADVIPLAELYLTPSLAAITNAQITDRRPRIESHEELTNSGDPNGAVAARWPYDLCWNTSVSPANPYVATTTDGTVGGTTWQPLADLLGGESAGDLVQYEDLTGNGDAGVLYPNPDAQKRYNLSLIPAHYNASGTHSGGGNTDAADRRTAKTPEGVELDIGGQSLILQAIQSLDLNTDANWDDSTYATASNRAGKDFYLYYTQPGSGTEPDLILSANATLPSSMPSGDTPTEDNTRKVAGFHCLCADVGTISGHPLSDYIQGDILPDSVWDLLHKPNAAPEGMTYDADSGVWWDIYLASWDGSEMVSAYNATIADGASSPSFHWYNFAELLDGGKRLPAQMEFQKAALGSPEETNISDSSDPGTTGGHSDTAGRRIISDIGCEDMAGVLWQWGAEGGATSDVGSAWEDADTAATSGSYDAQEGIGRGQHYEAPNRPRFGGYWGNGSKCGPRSSYWSDSPVHLASNGSARGVAEPAPAKR